MRLPKLPAAKGLALALLAHAAWGQPGATAPTGTRSFDQNWKFVKDSPAGAEKSAFADARWQTLDLPHDWSIGDLPNQTLDSSDCRRFDRRPSGRYNQEPLGRLCRAEVSPTH